MNITTFNFSATPLRVVMTDGEPWFVAADVIGALTLDRKALERLDDDEKGVNSVHTPGGEQQMTVISESGLYSLILGSRKPEAKKFKKWVTSEVLPAIRKTGQYVQPAVAPRPSKPKLDDRLDRMVDVLEKLIEVLPALLRSSKGARPGTRVPAKQMYEADMLRILQMRDAGAHLRDIVEATGFSQTRVWYVLTGKVQVQPGGRVVVPKDTKNESDKAAKAAFDAAVKAQDASAIPSSNSN